MKRWWRGNESWWVDYLEYELAQDVRQSLSLLLRHSPLHRRIVSNYARLKTALQILVNVEVPQESAYYDSLHERIMSEIPGPPGQDLDPRPGPKVQNAVRS